MADTPIVITIVGDVDPQAAANEVARTFATLPRRPARAVEYPGATATTRPQPGDHIFYSDHQTGARDDQSVSLALWPTAGYYADVRTAHRMNILAQILRNRLFDTLREKLGADYTPLVVNYTDRRLPDFGYISVESGVRTGDDPLFRATVAAIVSDLRTHPVGDDELARVKTPMLKDLQNEKNTNDYWYSTLTWLAEEPQARPTILSLMADIEATTPADLMALANRYLKDDAATFIRVEPQPAPLKWTPKVEGKRGFTLH